MMLKAQSTSTQPAPLVAVPDMAIAASGAAPPVEKPKVARRPKKTWREQRWERRRRRIWFEEVLGWILVPLIVVGLYYIGITVLGALGTSPAAIMNGISAITSNL